MKYRVRAKNGMGLWVPSKKYNQSSYLRLKDFTNTGCTVLVFDVSVSSYSSNVKNWNIGVNYPSGISYFWRRLFWWIDVITVVVKSVWGQGVYSRRVSSLFFSWELTLPSVVNKENFIKILWEVVFVLYPITNFRDQFLFWRTLS